MNAIEATPRKLSPMLSTILRPSSGRPTRRMFRLAMAVCTFGGLSSCSGNASTAVAAPTLQIAVSSGTASVVQGGNVQVQLTIFRGGSFEVAVEDLHRPQVHAGGLLAYCDSVD